MSNPNACARAGQDRANLYNEITDKIIAELEAGRVPLGSALGYGRGESAAGHAEKCFNRSILQRDQCSSALGKHDRAWLQRSKLAYVPAGAVAWRPCA